MSDDYHKDVRLKNTILLRERLKRLPSFMVEFFRSIENRTSSRTRIGYSYDLNIFFEFLTQNVERFMDKTVKELTLGDLNNVVAGDIESYMEYLSYYVKAKFETEGVVTKKAFENEALGKSRKLASLRTMFTYFYKKRKIGSNPSEFVDFPKTPWKAVIRLESDEVSRLLDEAESGKKLTKSQQYFHQYTKKRDVALLTLLLGTGMRVSECVGINIEHIDFTIGGVKIIRKGGEEVILYFSREVSEALSDYLDEREKAKALLGHESALFLSLQKRRLTDRAIQNLVKKYASLITTFKKITPHKLRSTFGTNLYNETNDIYLVSSVLGHTDVNTTKKHYVAMEDARRRNAAKAIVLRESKNSKEKQ